ncbi:hypothetical protein NDU88_008950 [Pleurodeles waltl]|uniref:Uncharacterized protein n=1 Tax=Pleurodeles waltl TaxID=8319 RepID=A0AAV7QT99_PLEWA|nr:hypothetical protein NDU88_008950 [Pleurodeles waltl]
MLPGYQPEGGWNTEANRQQKIEVKEQREREGRKEQRESGYIKKQEQQRRGVLEMGCEIPLASNQMQRNLVEEATGKMPIGQRRRRTRLGRKNGGVHHLLTNALTQRELWPSR